MNVVENGEIVTEETLRGKARIWNDEETDLLIDLLEQNACLWDVFSKEYHLRDRRDKAYETLRCKKNLTFP